MLFRSPDRPADFCFTFVPGDLNGLQGFPHSGKTPVFFCRIPKVSESFIAAPKRPGTLSLFLFRRCRRSLYFTAVSHRLFPLLPAHFSSSCRAHCPIFPFSNFFAVPGGFLIQCLPFLYFIPFAVLSHLPSGAAGVFISRPPRPHVLPAFCLLRSLRPLRRSAPAADCARAVFRTAGDNAFTVSRPSPSPDIFPAVHTCRTRPALLCHPACLPGR